MNCFDVFGPSPVIGLAPAQTNCPFPSLQPRRISIGPQSPSASNHDEFDGSFRLLYQEVYSYRTPTFTVRFRLTLMSFCT
jgi:hypothetical protein